MTGWTEGGASLNQTLPIEHPNRFGRDDSGWLDTLKTDTTSTDL